eukprot:TRINITY_DN275_c0_g1_i7.p1 TRINITY_DN275_c0_g1~~TRINITY_DN275_c0_g1_i7.p1  ORF type:complete len:237 (-),score=-15.05 TRINITY_DN275_c0_g1_i7:1157-1867(-)
MHKIYTKDVDQYKRKQHLHIQIITTPKLCSNIGIAKTTHKGQKLLLLQQQLFVTTCKILLITNQHIYLNTTNSIIVLYIGSLQKQLQQFPIQNYSTEQQICPHIFISISISISNVWNRLFFILQELPISQLTMLIYSINQILFKALKMIPKRLLILIFGRVWSCKAYKCTQQIGYLECEITQHIHHICNHSYPMLHPDNLTHVQRSYCTPQQFKNSMHIRGLCGRLKIYNNCVKLI